MVRKLPKDLLFNPCHTRKEILPWDLLLCFMVCNNLLGYCRIKHGKRFTLQVNCPFLMIMFCYTTSYKVTRVDCKQLNVQCSILWLCLYDSILSPGLFSMSS